MGPPRAADASYLLLEPLGREPQTETPMRRLALLALPLFLAPPLSATAADRFDTSAQCALSGVQSLDPSIMTVVSVLSIVAMF